jgi:hypothetical protein
MTVNMKSTHLAAQTLDHRFLLHLWIVRPPTPTEPVPEVLTVLVLRILYPSTTLLLILPFQASVSSCIATSLRHLHALAIRQLQQRTSLTHPRSRTVTSKCALAEQLDLLVLPMARDVACRAHTRPLLHLHLFFHMLVICYVFWHRCTSKTEMHRLTDVAQRVRARVEAVRDGARSVSEKRALLGQEVRCGDDYFTLRI